MTDPTPFLRFSVYADGELLSELTISPENAADVERVANEQGDVASDALDEKRVVRLIVLDERGAVWHDETIRPS